MSQKSFQIAVRAKIACGSVRHHRQRHPRSITAIAAIESRMFRIVAAMAESCAVFTAPRDRTCVAAVDLRQKMRRTP
ncbi:hypothetical protein B5V02_31945 [Mesorhizobium kowhaii]|uniref:Uncharacterized protein n=1 Tax=Mesorhizobium kowhaii TaxID=1300272 RepID=A0A2W7BYZ3_9HYPH|nr:hypothetical protein B5V02_31945 [Mesorhizobium kowhaii]